MGDGAVAASGGAGVHPWLRPCPGLDTLLWQYRGATEAPAHLKRVYTLQLPLRRRLMLQLGQILGILGGDVQCAPNVHVEALQRVQDREKRKTFS
jgi:hypothetical protein